MPDPSSRPSARLRGRWWFLAVAAVVLVGCTWSGCGGDDQPAAKCRESPTQPPDDAVEAEAERGEVWALGLGVPPEAGEEWKIVWRVTGEGDFEVVAVDPDGESHEPTVRPKRHESSSFDRPGDEWGTFFRFPTPGCWKLIATRGDTLATVTVRVVD